jgi:hypothetical protein
MHTAMVAALSGSLVLALAGTADAACSNRTIRGDYAFTVQGNVLSEDGTRVLALLNGLGIISYDGNGNLVQQDLIVANGKPPTGGPQNPSGFTTGETGTYTVNSDCTGTQRLVLGPGNELNLVLVVSNNGNSVHSMVTSGTANGVPTNFQTRGDAERINPRE